MQLVVHGGAGAEPDEPAARQAVLDDAASVGARAGAPLDAVVAAMAVLEDSPRFNAGVGGSVQADGVVRTDAGVMTDGREVGAVCSVPGVARATAAARIVLERTPHVLVGGEHAARLAGVAGIETDVDLLTAATRERYANADPPDVGVTDGDPEAILDWVRDRFGAEDHPGGNALDHDTVGAVAVGEDGALAVATSTGGRWFAFPGRIGDSPQVGSGFFAGSHGGASATGHGEAIARVNLARRAVDRLGAGDDPEEAADRAVAVLEEEVGGDAGVIVADRTGEVGTACNTDRMQTATARR